MNATTVTNIGPVRPGRPNRWVVSGAAGTFNVTDRSRQCLPTVWHKACAGDRATYAVEAVPTIEEALAIAAECAMRGGEIVMVERRAARIAAVSA